MRLTYKQIALYAGILFLLFVLGSVLFFIATPKEIRVTEPLTTEYSVSDPQFKVESGQFSGRQWVYGNDIEILDRGQDIFDAMFEDIENAEHSITKETYNFWGDEVGTPMANALANASERGVKVHFLMDFVGSVNADSEKFDIMEDAEVEVERWRKPAWYQLARFNHRTHRKLLITDNNVAYTGGVNTADNWLHDIDEGGYKDYHFRITGPVVSELQGAFSENWVAARSELLTGQTYYAAPDSSGEIYMQVSSSHPREGRQKVRKMLLHAITSADESIRIGSAYFFPDDRFIEAIVDAAERGVEVQILTPGEAINKSFFRHASHTLWGELFDAGVEMYEYQPTMYHPKFMIVDEYFVTLGSTNFDNRSFQLNDEANVNILNGDFATELAGHFEEDLNQSEPISQSEWEARPLRHRLLGHLVAIVLGPYL